MAAARTERRLVARRAVRHAVLLVKVVGADRLATVLARPVLRVPVPAHRLQHFAGRDRHFALCALTTRSPSGSVYGASQEDYVELAHRKLSLSYGHKKRFIEFRKL